MNAAGGMRPDVDTRGQGTVAKTCASGAQSHRPRSIASPAPLGVASPGRASGRARPGLVLLVTSAGHEDAGALVPSWVDSAPAPSTQVAEGRPRLARIDATSTTGSDRDRTLSLRDATAVLPAESSTTNGTHPKRVPSANN